MKPWILAAVWAFSAAAARPVLAEPVDSDESAIEERGGGEGARGWARGGRRGKFREFLGGGKGGGEVRKAMKERRELRTKTREVRRRYLEAKTSDERKSLRTELEKAIGAEMDMRLKHMETRLQKLRERLPVLEKKLASGKKNRDKLVKLRLELLDAESGKGSNYRTK